LGKKSYLQIERKLKNLEKKKTQIFFPSLHLLSCPLVETAEIWRLVKHILHVSVMVSEERTAL
jgi:hypothetical protein